MSPFAVASSAMDGEPGLDGASLGRRGEIVGRADGSVLGASLARAEDGEEGLIRVGDQQGRVGLVMVEGIGDVLQARGSEAEHWLAGAGAGTYRLT